MSESDQPRNLLDDLTAAVIHNLAPRVATVVTDKDLNDLAKRVLTRAALYGNDDGDPLDDLKSELRRLRKERLQVVQKLFYREKDPMTLMNISIDEILGEIDGYQNSLATTGKRNSSPGEF